jgi:hypothetical protein
LIGGTTIQHLLRKSGIRRMNTNFKVVKVFYTLPP